MILNSPLTEKNCTRFFCYWHNFTIMRYLKLGLFFTGIALCLIMSSCSDDGIKVSSSKINGPLGDYFELVDKNYKVNDGRITVEVKRIKEGGPKEANWNSRPTFVLDVMDGDDAILGNDATDVVFDEEQLEAIFVLREGESSAITFSIPKNIADKIKAIKMSSKWDEDKETESQNEKSENEEAETEETSSFELSNVLLPSQLKGKVEVISAEKSVSSYGYPSMEITFKLLSKVNTSSMCSEYGQMWIVGVGQTENGVDVKELLPNYREWRSGDSDGNEFKEFLESEPGETITLEFTGDKDSSNDVESDLEKVKKFKLKITN